MNIKAIPNNDGSIIITDGKQTIIRMYGKADVVQARMDDYLKLKEREAEQCNKQ